MVRSSIFYGFAALASLAAAQLLPQTPACAQQCPVLTGMQTSCESNPPAAQSCLCQFASLQVLKSAPQQNLCNGICSDGDWQAIVKWYTSTCANGGANAGAPASTLATSASAAAGNPTQGIVAATGPAGKTPPTAAPNSSNQPQSATSGSDGADDNAAANYKNGSQWWSSHYGYVIMLIVLVLVFGGLGAIGTIWYRRRQRNKIRNMATVSGNASQWAPNGSTHNFNDAAERQARGALAAQPGSLGGAAMVERANSRRATKGKMLGGVLGRGRR